MEEHESSTCRNSWNETCFAISGTTDTVVAQHNLISKNDGKNNKTLAENVGKLIARREYD